MSFEETMTRWLRAQPGVPETAVFERVSHEDSWTNDSGTGWPAETIVSYRVSPRARGQRQVYAPGDVEDLLRELFEFADAADTTGAATVDAPDA